MEISFLEKFGFYARLIFIAVIAAVLIGVLIYMRSPSVRILNETQKAYEYEAQGDYEKAVSTLTEAVQKYPEQVSGYEALSQLCLRWGDQLMQEGQFEEGLLKLKAAESVYNTVQTKDSAVRIILDNTAVDPDDAEAVPSGTSVSERYDSAIRHLLTASTVFDDSRFEERENELVREWISFSGEAQNVVGERETVKHFQDYLAEHPDSVPCVMAYQTACLDFAQNRRSSVSENNEPVEIYREMNQAVYMLRQWAGWISEFEIEAAWSCAGTLEACAEEYEIERAGLIVRSQERIAREEAARAALAAANAKARFVSFQLKYADHGVSQYSIACAITEHSGFGQGCSVYQIRSGVNDESAQTWLIQKDYDDGSYKQLIYNVDLVNMTFVQTQYRYTENGEEKQEERMTDPFSYAAYLDNESFVNGFINNIEQITDVLTVRIADMLAGKETAAPDQSDEEASAREDENAEAMTEIWTAFRYYTDGVMTEGSEDTEAVSAHGLAYYRTSCIYDDMYHEFIVLQDGNGMINIREVTLEE